MLHFSALLKRYTTVFKHAWKNRSELEGKPKQSHEAEFLPAALALQEHPVSPLPRALTWLIISFAIIALLWACFGRIEIVATAQGKIIPSSHTKIIQPKETATVKAIHVTDGQVVKVGDVLIDLDATDAEADLTRVNEDLLTAQLEAMRAEGFLKAVEGRIGTTQSLYQSLLDKMHADVNRRKEEEARLQSEIAEFQAKRAKLDALVAQHSAEMQSTKQLITKLAQTAPIAAERASDYKNLLAKNFISKHGYLEKEQISIENEGDLAAQRAHLTEIAAEIEAAQRERTAFVAESIRQRRDILNEAHIKIQQLTQDQRKADQHNSLMQLTSPVDGVVQQLAIHTIGGVVTPAQALLAIVPQENALEVDANLENKDIGFVFAGQPAEIKLETFPYTKYGTLKGKVNFVSNDAAPDEKKGLIYQARVSLTKTSMQVDDKLVNLSPGMAVTVEIKTGSRRVIEYFLSPLLQYKNESLRER